MEENGEVGQEYLFKIMLIGDSTVGKSNLMSRFCRNEFEAKSKASIGVDFQTKFVEIDGKEVRAQIWDTAGQERFRAFTSAYYRGAVGALIVYDISRRSTFDSIKRWLEELDTKKEGTVARMLVGNKCDLEYLRDVSTEEGKSLAEREGLFFMETSALNSTNVQTAFEIVIRDIYNNISCKVLNYDTYKAELALKRVSLANEAGSVVGRSLTPPTSVVASQAQGPNFHEKLKPYFSAGLQKKWDKFSLDQLFTKFIALRDTNIREAHFFEMALTERHQLLSDLQDLDNFKNKFYTEQAALKKRAEDAEFIAHKFQVQLKEAQTSKATVEETAKSVADKLKFAEHNYSGLMKERNQLKKNFEDSDLRVAELEMEVDTLKSKVSHLEKAVTDMDSKFEAYGHQIRG